LRTANPKVLKMTLDPCFRARCVEVDRKKFVGRRELRNPPSSNTLSSRKKNIWKDSDE
jgi:hypothetical protein